ncbi:MAG TPA: oligosaccharide flippase family protein [Kofleriaceae bacterium]|jgi:PST family polysaccharide transporter|nr:oligosaccharide flippase family protein [Kofleriaceae bacterium]
MSETSTAASSSSLTARTVRGAAWTLSTSLGTRVIGLVGTLLLARYLVPDEYGEVTAAMIVTLTAFTATSLGVGNYLLANPTLGRSEVFHATVWFVSTGAVALGVVWAASGAIGPWVDAPHLARYMPVFVAAALCDRIEFLPERMLIRKLRFRWLSLARAAGELTYTGVSLGLARAGVGPMSIAWAYLARSALKLIAVALAVDWREWLELHRLSAAKLRAIIHYGSGVSVASIAAALIRRWDNLLVSRYFGAAAMGAYNYAYNLADTPATAIGEQMSDVVTAAFPQAEGAKRQAALVRACTMISLIMFPLAFGLGAVADTAVAVFFNRSWANVGPMLMYLSILSAPRPLAQIVQSYLFAGHRVRTIVWLEWGSFLTLMATIAAIGALTGGDPRFSASGVLWTCGAVGVVFMLRTLASFWSVTLIDGVPMRRFLVPLVRPLIACAIMVAAIFAVRPALAGQRPVVRLGLEVVLGAAVYLAGARLIFRAAAVEFLGLVRGSLGRRR